MGVGFIGLGKVGGKISRSLLRNGAVLTVHELNADLVEALWPVGQRQVIVRRR